MQTLAKNEKTNTLFSNLYIGRTVGNKGQRAQGIAGWDNQGIRIPGYQETIR
jgi:hypothetical protein